MNSRYKRAPIGSSRTIGDPLQRYRRVYLDARRRKIDSAFVGKNRFPGNSAVRRKRHGRREGSPGHRTETSLFLFFSLVAEREDKGAPELEGETRVARGVLRDCNRKRELAPIVSQGSTLALKSPRLGDGKRRVARDTPR